MTGQVAVLFARRDSIYKTLLGCDVYDIDRDARTWPGGCPVVAHPPCRGWGNLKHMAKPRAGEKDLAVLAVNLIRRWGGVLEHPQRSTLWEHCRLPKPGPERDQHGGWTLAAPQKWWGHRAEKPTLFYIVGIAPRSLPLIPLVMGRASHVVTQPGRLKSGLRRTGATTSLRPEITKAERERTPPLLAEWLVELTRRCLVEPAEVAA